MERPPIACTLNVADFVERSELWRQVIEGWGIKARTNLRRDTPHVPAGFGSGRDARRACAARSSMLPMDANCDLRAAADSHATVCR